LDAGRQLSEEIRSNHERKSSFVLCSSRDSTSNGVFSILGALEVILAVTGYWVVAAWMHAQGHLFLAVLVAPLLLLRSDESITLGNSWFRGVEDKATSVVNSSVNWSERISAKIPIFGKTLEALIFIAMVLVVGYILPFVAAFLIRFVVTSRYLIPGIKSLSNNWWRTLFATDIFTVPEIMPGYSKEGPFVFSYLLAQVRASKTEGTVERYVTLILASFFLVLFVPSFLYRMSIKSTAWLHWPLAYLSRPLRYANDPEEVRMRLWGDPREWLRRVAMVVTFLGALVASVPSFSTVKAAFPTGALSIAEYAVLIDVKTLFGHPWRLAALISAVITLMLTWYGLELSLLIKSSRARPDRLISAEKWASALEYAMRLRDICGWIFWGLVFGHATLWLAPSTSWLKGYPQEILQFIYGDYLPPRLSL
jgi:hypothetical protein